MNKLKNIHLCVALMSSIACSYILHAQTPAIFYDPDTYSAPTTVNYIYYPAHGNKVVVQDYFGTPETEVVTTSEAASYEYDAYLHRDYDEDDQYDKMYYDRVKGGTMAAYANRKSDDDFDQIGY